jgi:hypothetical protein
MRHNPFKRWLVFNFLALAVSILLSSCGGGEDGDDTRSTGTISGSVAGTTVIVVNDTGEIVASAHTKGRLPDLDLDGDDIKESYAFVVSDVPMNMSIRIYLVMSDGLFPMYFDDNGVEANVFSLSSSADINLGFVDIVAGRATPQHNPLDTREVDPEGADGSVLTISGASIDDFQGTWQGSVPYLMADGEYGSADITMVLTVDGSLLVGTFYNSRSGTTVDITGSEINGIFTFDLPTATLAHPDCVNWDVTFTTILDKYFVEMDITGSGLFCGTGGGKSGTFSGFLLFRAF